MRKKEKLILWIALAVGMITLTVNPITEVVVVVVGFMATLVIYVVFKQLIDAMVKEGDIYGC